MIEVSFDFDGILDRPEVQEYCKSLFSKDIPIIICTFRYADGNWPADYPAAWKTNEDMYKVTDKLGISRSDIYFTNYTDKGKFFANRNTLWHLDDDKRQCVDIMRYSSCNPILFNPELPWKFKCNRLLESINQVKPTGEVAKSLLLRPKKSLL